MVDVPGDGDKGQDWWLVAGQQVMVWMVHWAVAVAALVRVMGLLAIVV